MAAHVDADLVEHARAVAVRARCETVATLHAELTPESMIVCDLDGRVVPGDLSPSSDTAAHAYVYRAMPEVGGVVHTHSTYASAWAARGEAIPCVLTAMADEFGGEIPVGPFALIGGPHAEPRGLHDRADATRRGQGRGDVRRSRPYRARTQSTSRVGPCSRRRVGWTSRSGSLSLVPTS